MRFLFGTAIVVFVTVISALVPFAFRERMEIWLGSSVVCETLGTGVRLGHINADKRKLLFDAVAESSDINARSKAIVDRAKAGCQ
jgi:hypothetical protein